MKNYFLVMAALILSIQVAQSQSAENGIFSEPYHGKIPTKNQTSKPSYSNYYDLMFVREADSMLFQNCTNHSGYLWPDTNIILPNGSQNKIFAIAQMLDPESYFFMDIFPKNENSTKSTLIMNLTHIGLYCIYERVPSLQNAIDTIIIQVKLAKTPIMTYSGNNEPWVYSEYGTSAINFVMIDHDEQSILSSQSDYYTYKFPLDSNAVYDTVANGLNFFKLPLYLMVSISNYANMFGHESVSISYKPGFSYSASDSITQVNRLRFISTQEFGDGGGGTCPSYLNGDYNCSYVLHKDAFYQTGNYSDFLTSSFSDTIFTPHYAFKANYPFEYHWIEFGFTLLVDGGFDEQNSEEFVIYPNPANDKVFFDFPIETPEKSTLKIFDINGKIIVNKEIWVQDGFSVAEFPAGIYFATIQQENGRLYKSKFVIER